MKISPAGYWRVQIRRTLSLLAIWAIVSFGASIVAIDALNAFTILGMPLGFWMAQQGSILVFIVLVWYFAWSANRVDQAAGLEEDASHTTPPTTDH